MRKAQFIGAAAAIATAMTLGLSSLLAQSRERTPPSKADTKGKDVTLVGTIVDLQCYMTGDYPTKDEADSARKCIRAGVPAALETEHGLVILGMGYRGPARELVRHAMATVEVKGTLYEKQGVRYLDIATVKSTKPTRLESNEDEGGEWEEEEEPEEEPEPEDPDDPPNNP